MKSTNQNN